MTSSLLDARPAPVRRVRTRHFLMCPPRHFDVVYAINPWMRPELPVDRHRAMAQWSALVAGYRAAGHRVDVLDPVPGLPDMVFAANGATVVDGRVLQARFAHPERAAEAERHGAWHRSHPAGPVERTVVVTPVATNEAEGDFAVLPHRILAGHGFRTSLDAHAELARLTGREVVSLQLVDPRYYHLDVALAVLDDEREHVVYHPDAFSADSRRTLARLFPDALLATAADAAALGLNAVSDGCHVWLPAGTPTLADALAGAGYLPQEVDLSELHLGGGSVKCCTQEIRPVPAPATPSAPTRQETPC